MKRKHVLFYFFVFLFSTLQGQVLRELSINTITGNEVPVIQGNAQFPDDALLLVYSPIKSLNFRSTISGIDKQTYNPELNRYEILLKPLKQIVFVYAADYLEAKVETFTPSPKDVYYYKVEEKQNSVTRIAESGSVYIESEPEGADISLNGILIRDKTPFTGNFPGTVKITLSKKEYASFDTTIAIPPRQAVKMSVKLKPLFLVLNISSEPSGAEVILGGVLFGKTPLSKKMYFNQDMLPGNKTLELQLAGYQNVKEDLLLVPGLLPFERHVLMKRLQGTFFISSEPKGAEVMINGMYKGLTPLSGKLDYGEYEVKLKAEGCVEGDIVKLIINNSIQKELHLNLNTIEADKMVKAEIAKADSIAKAEMEKAMAESADRQQFDDFVASKKVIIGNQEWMAKNLDVDRFFDGYSIQEAKADGAWMEAGEKKEPAWCYYENNSANGAKYGKLYNWYAINSPHKLCPEGWHVPTDAEWTTLTNFLGGQTIAGGKMKSTGTQYWISPNTSADNSSGFSGLPGGNRSSNGAFSLIGNSGYWWSSTEFNTDIARYRNLFYDDGYVSRNGYYKTLGFSVRCIKD
jgi:uncharacterized protein (TIGR02145 family)